MTLWNLCVSIIESGTMCTTLTEEIENLLKIIWFALSNILQEP